ncbi:glycosyltransferase family 2 protein [Microbacterium stercoris]|uniref:Glycosyltransferase family 2 protein n=1 Tax=Microbacterium stercoris TaxID=2820289 RepID=A0A939TW35_9MICO|nr:glycosyltransferase family 2 protein [Microbacterium stercoris]MBO3662222.1 glycosyltransferase family 2 protein [Microbacterium stercoris]
MARSKEAGKLERFAGLAILGLTIAAAAALWGLLAATNVRPFWDPDSLPLWGLTVRYDLHAPAVLIIVGALVLAVIAGVGIALFEDTVVKAFRRTDPGVEKRPLAPRRVMAETRGVFLGDVTITVVIPAHNEENAIGETIASLRSQTTPPERIIVVADNCTDRTVEIARSAGVEVFETVANAHKKAGGLNQVLTVILPDAGRNDAIMVMDADTQLANHVFLETARRYLTNDRALMAVGGLFLGEPGHGLLGLMQRNEYTRYSLEIERRRGRVFVLSGTATVFRPEALRTVAESRGTLLPGVPGDVYDTIALTEDNELTLAIKTLGGLTLSPRECTVVTELMPTWRALWRQRLRWQRGAIENLAAYGVTPVSVRYWAQQIGIGYSVIALSSYFVLLILMIVSMDTWVWFPFWIALGCVFSLERLVTVWRGGWRARVLAVLVLPEAIFDLFLDVVFVKGIIDMTFRREAKWTHGTAVTRDGASA